MQIVSPTYSVPRGRAKRAKKSHVPTPEQYRGHYSHLQRKLGGNNYRPRAADPGAQYAKTMKQCIKHNEARDSGAARAIIFSEKRDGFYSTIFGGQFDNINAEWAEGIPHTTLEGDMQQLQDRIAEEKRENTLKTFTSRIKMLLGTMFEVNEMETTRAMLVRAYSSDRIVLDCNGNTVIIIPKMEA